MYLVAEYLTYLALVAALGGLLFVGAAIGLVAKEGAARLKNGIREKTAQFAARNSLKKQDDPKNLLQGRT